MEGGWRGPGKVKGCRHQGEGECCRRRGHYHDGHRRPHRSSALMGEPFTGANTLGSHQALRGGHCHRLCFQDEETEAQSGELISPNHAAREEQGWDMNGAVCLQNLFKIQKVYQNYFLFLQQKEDKL